MNKTTMRTLPAAMLLAMSGLASAAGYQALEQNASGLGVAYAGSAAIADNAATLFANPAGMSRLPGISLSMGAVGISQHHRFRSNAGAVSGGDAGESNVLSNAYLTWQFTPALTVGLGISQPYLLDTRYDAGWVGSASGIETELTTVNINPAIAYQVNNVISLGAGLSYQKMDLRLTATGSDFKGDDNSLGWNVGALFTLSPAMRVGVAYRSKIEHDVAGRAADTPAALTLSVWQQVSDRWEAMGDLSSTRWKSVDFTGMDFDNAWRLAWGAAYRYGDQSKLKFGIAYDRSPVKTRTRTVRMPDSSSLWLTLGGQWAFGRSSVLDVGYAYRYMRDARVRDGAANGKYDSDAHVVGVQYSIGF
ncbi:MAG: OmpP1/FadL family transporter [Dechloromonas sp.]|nr:OmpP1/FadL family transporter [Dechloromonas sp.]